MLKFIDLWIEKIFLKILHRQRKKIIEKGMSKFLAKHPDASQDLIDKLSEQLEDEADRIYAVVDKSIVRERIKRAKYTFWVTAISAVIIVGVLGGFSSGTALPFVIPIVMAVVAWIVSLVTIPVSYNERIKGAMDSTIIVFEKNYLGPNPRKKLNNKEQLEEMKKELFDLNQKFEKLKEKINKQEKTQETTNSGQTYHEELFVNLTPKSKKREINQMIFHFWKKCTSKKSTEENNNKHLNKYEFRS